MNERTLTPEEQKDLVAAVALLTGFVSKFAALTDPLVYFALRGACAKATDLLIDFEPDELVRARMRKEMQDSKDNCSCSFCKPQPPQKLDS